MWNKKRSILLSKIFIIAFLAVFAACMIFGPWLADFVMISSRRAQEWQAPWFLATIYTGGVLVLAILGLLLAVVWNVGRGIVFDRRNISRLRLISWLCMAGAAICLASSIYYLPWLLVCMAGAFIGLMVRIVKNILAEATLLKEENDYTI